jgi:hypothetical protein
MLDTGSVPPNSASSGARLDISFSVSASISKKDTPLLKAIAMETATVVPLWEENKPEDMVSFMTFGYALSDIDGVVKGEKRLAL